MRSFYLERRTWLHGVPAWVKLAVLSATGTILFAGGPALTAGAAITVIILYATLGTAAWRSLATLRRLAVVLVLLFLFHAVTGSLRTGLETTLRLAALAVLGLMLTLSTRFDDLLMVAERVLAPLRVLGLSADRPALAFGLMLRFIEIFFLKWQQLDEAYRARGGKAGRWRLLAPLALQVLATAERVGEALSARQGR